MTKKTYKSVTSIDAREHFADHINSVVYGCVPIIITRRGRALCAIVPLRDFEKSENCSCSEKKETK